MRGHSPFVQERKGDRMGHKPTPCCGSWMRGVKEDTKKSLIHHFTSAPENDCKKVFLHERYKRGTVVSLCADKECSLLCAMSLKTAIKCKNLGTKWSRTPRPH